MKSKISPAVIGFFVIGFFALGIVALLSFGGMSLFSKPQRFLVYFDESIHGLDLGASVKLRGVRVGRVVAINVRYDEVKRQSDVAVVCELNRNIITDAKGGLIDVTARKELDRLVDQGMRAQLGVVGLATGLLYVELGFPEADDKQELIRLTDPKYCVIPAVPSVISEFNASISEILSDLKRVDFAGLSKNFNKVLVTTDKKIGELDTAGLSTQWKQAAEAVEKVASDPQIKAAIVNLNAAITDLRTTIAHVDGQVAPTGDKLRETLAEAQKAIQGFNEAAATARRFISAQSGLGEEATKSLQQMAEAAAAIQRLADFLERNPNALITGKKQPQPK